MIEKFATKELYEATFKTTDNMTIFGKEFEPDETVLFFNQIQIANISEGIVRHTAHGGKNDFNLIGWESVKETDFQFEDGLLSPIGLGFLSQSQFFNSGINNLTVPIREQLISDSLGNIMLKYAPSSGRAIFIYKIVGGILTDKITSYSAVNNVISLGEVNKYTSIVIDYYFTRDDISLYEIGGERFKGFLKLTAKIYIVDEQEGIRQTVMFSMPKVKIMSNLNMTLGTKVNPVVSTFRLTAYPDFDGKTLARFFFLGEDIEG